MGINERDYIRNPPPGAPGAGLSGLASRAPWRMWSVNTWLIVICVSVFVIDGFTGYRWVGMSGKTLIKDFHKIDTSQLRAGPVFVPLRDGNDAPLPPRRNLYLATNPSIPVAWENVQQMHFLEKYLHFSTARALIYPSSTWGLTGFEFWRLIGFQFLHANFTHLLFNMVGLYFFGSIVERYLGSKRYLAFYLLCGIFGALMYVLLNVSGLAVASISGKSIHIPGLLFNDPATSLIGASAGVFGVLMAGAFLVPNAIVLLFLIIPMKLRTLAYVLVGVALFSVLFGTNNAGGEAGHLGGAIAGFYFIRHPKHLHGFFDFLGRVDPTSHHYRDKRRTAGMRPGRIKRGEIDRILDKINAKGIHSLSDKEKRLLKDASTKD